MGFISIDMSLRKVKSVKFWLQFYGYLLILFGIIDVLSGVLLGQCTNPVFSGLLEAWIGFILLWFSNQLRDALRYLT